MLQHHTELMFREMRYQATGDIENAFALLLSPAATICEGLATIAVKVVFPDDEREEWNEEVLYPRLGIEPHPRDMRCVVRHATDTLFWYPRGNAAFRLHTGNANEAETLECLRTMGLNDDLRAEQCLKFIKDPQMRAYVFTYTAGCDLIEAAALGNRCALLRRLLTEGWMLPRDLVALQHNAIT